eukprot:844373-Prorocentrum_minimum.AAC.1
MATTGADMATTGVDMATTGVAAWLVTHLGPVHHERVLREVERGQAGVVTHIIRGEHHAAQRH